MSRKILIVDHSATIRRILRTMTLANINDAEVIEAENTTDATAILHNHTVNLILFSGESNSERWLDFIDATKSEAANERLNFVLFTSRPCEKSFAKARAAGVTAQLVTPCTAATFTETINRACNPTLLRESRRYNIPGSTATLTQGAISLATKVINISQGGILCELPLPEAMNWAAPVTATVNFPDSNGGARVVDNLFAVISSYFVQTRNPDHSPKLVRIALRFLQIPEDAAATLEKVFRQAAKEEQIV